MIRSMSATLTVAALLSMAIGSQAVGQVDGRDYLIWRKSPSAASGAETGKAAAKKGRKLQARPKTSKSLEYQKIQLQNKSFKDGVR
jgi:hypothetical protein